MEGQSNNVVFNALPGNEEIKNLLAQIEFMIQSEGMILKSVSVGDGSSGSVDAIGSVGKDYKTIQGSMELSGSYGQFKKLLVDLETLDRVMNVTEFSIEGGSDGGEGVSSGSFSLKFEAYYQELVTAEKMKSALEANDISD